MTKAVWGRVARAALVAVALTSVSCGEQTRQGQSAAYLVVTTLQAAAGDEPANFGGSLDSDVSTGGGIFPDFGQVTFGLRLKDPGAPTAPNSPSPNNAITVNRYHVTFIRADGRNTPGVDVPYAFDGAFTVTVAGEASATFTLVRQQAKNEPPLRALATNALVISTIAEITFYGHDQTGREASVVGRISVNFADFGD